LVKRSKSSKNVPIVRSFTDLLGIINKQQIPQDESSRHHANWGKWREAVSNGVAMCRRILGHPAIPQR
jgi:hypothetical protein